MVVSSPLSRPRRRRVAGRETDSGGGHRSLLHRRPARSDQSDDSHHSAASQRLDRGRAPFPRGGVPVAPALRVHEPPDPFPRPYRGLLSSRRHHSMIQSALTISLVPEARGGPFVFWDDLPAGLARAAKLGFDAVEIFPRSVEDLNAKELKRLLKQHRLKLAAMGTGAAWVVHQLRLTDPDPKIRAEARAFAGGVID